MPAYATSMRLKFPILALVLEVITIILFGVFAVYDHDKGHGHDAPSNQTHQEDNPMDLYPSKSGHCSTAAFGLASVLYVIILSVPARGLYCLVGSAWRAQMQYFFVSSTF